MPELYAQSRYMYVIFIKNGGGLHNFVRELMKEEALNEGPFTSV